MFKKGEILLENVLILTDTINMDALNELLSYLV